jgi:hypothetical protein
MVRKKEAIILQVVKIICNMHQLTECQLGNVQRKKSIEVYHNATLFAGVENILDTQYRTFSSGINAPEEIWWISIQLLKEYSLK